jgi:hypothetical protein
MQGGCLLKGLKITSMVSGNLIKIVPVINREEFYYSSSRKGF